VVVFDHQVRNIELSKQGEREAREYVRTVHNDYGYTDRRDRAECESTCRQLKQKSDGGYRFAEINVWRPIRGPIESTPLAVCDAESIEPDDFVPADFVYHDQSRRSISFHLQPQPPFGPTSRISSVMRRSC